MLYPLPQHPRADSAAMPQLWLSMPSEGGKVNIRPRGRLKTYQHLKMAYSGSGEDYNWEKSSN